MDRPAPSHPRRLPKWPRTQRQEAVVSCFPPTTSMGPANSAETPIAAGAGHNCEARTRASLASCPPPPGGAKVDPHAATVVLLSMECLFVLFDIFEQGRVGRVTLPTAQPRPQAVPRGQRWPPAHDLVICLDLPSSRSGIA